MFYDVRGGLLIGDIYIISKNIFLIEVNIKIGLQLDTNFLPPSLYTGVILWLF